TQSLLTFSFMQLLRPSSTLFPYTTLFRSLGPKLGGLEQVTLEPRDAPRVGEIGPVRIEAHGRLHARRPRRPRVHVEEHLGRRAPHLVEDGASRAGRGLAPAAHVRHAYTLGEPLERAQQPVSVDGDVHPLEPDAAPPP